MNSLLDSLERSSRIDVLDIPQGTVVVEQNKQQGGLLASYVLQSTQVLYGRTDLEVRRAQFSYNGSSVTHGDTQLLRQLEHRVLHVPGSLQADWLLAMCGVNEEHVGVFVTPEKLHQAQLESNCETAEELEFVKGQAEENLDIHQEYVQNNSPLAVMNQVMRTQSVLNTMNEISRVTQL